MLKRIRDFFKNYKTRKQLKAEIKELESRLGMVVQPKIITCNHRVIDIVKTRQFYPERECFELDDEMVKYELFHSMENDLISHMDFYKERDIRTREIVANARLRVVDNKINFR